MNTEQATETHYEIEGKKYARVTHLMRSMGLVDYDKIPERDREFYLDRGTQNHKAWQMAEEGIADRYEFDPVVEAYRPAHSKFLEETGFSPIPGGIELLVKSEALGVAGRLDRIGTFPARPGRVAVVDYKTTSVHPATAIQTALYLILIPGYNFFEVDRFGVAFRNDGTYRMEHFKDRTDRDDALALIRTYNLKERMNK